MIMSFEDWFDKYEDIGKYAEAYADYLEDLSENGVYEPVDYYEFMLDEYYSWVGDYEDAEHDRMREERMFND